MTRFHMKKVCIAFGSAFALCVAVQAQAAVPLANSALNTATLDGFLAGSTAFEPAIRAYMRSICSSTVEEFQVSAVSQTGAAIYNPSPANQRQLVFQCATLTSNIGSSNALTLRKSSGDSGEGLTAAAGLYPVNFIDTASAQAVAGFTCGTSTVTPAETGLAALEQQTCTYSTSTGSAFITATNGLAGISDVEPAILNAAILGAVPDISSAVITVDNIAAAVWGVPVTKTFRNKLQGVQGLAVGSDLEADMPSLSRTTLYSIFTGVLGNADALTDASNAGITTIAPISANGNRLFFVRRPESSGTMASFKAMFGNTPCTGTAAWAGDGAAVGACSTSTASLTGKQTITFQSTGNLLGCLKTLDGISTGGRYGVGIASSANNPVPNNDPTKDALWRYVKVDGYAPTLVNAATGHYPFVTEAAFQVPAVGPLVPSGDAVTLIANLKAGLRSPTVIAKVNNDNTGADQQYGGFQTGYVVTAATPGALPTYPLNAVNMRTNPVIPGTRNTANANSCQPVLNFTGGKIPVNQP